MNPNERPFLHPFTEKEIPLKYDWEGFSSVTLWGSRKSLEDIDAWYNRDEELLNETDFETARTYYDRHGGDSVKFSICMAATSGDDPDEVEDALDGLAAYIADDNLIELAKEGYDTVGVYFIHDEEEKS